MIFLALNIKNFRIRILLKNILIYRILLSKGSFKMFNQFFIFLVSASVMFYTLVSFARCENSKDYNNLSDNLILLYSLYCILFMIYLIFSFIK